MKRSLILLLLFSLLLSLPVFAAAPEDVSLSSADLSDAADTIRSSLDEIRAMSDAELGDAIRQFASKYHVTLTDGQTEQLLSLCRKLSELDGDKLEEKLNDLKDDVLAVMQKASDAGETVENVKGRVSSLWERARSLFSRVSDFFTNIFDKIQKRGKKPWYSIARRFFLRFSRRFSCSTGSFPVCAEKTFFWVSQASFSMRSGGLHSFPFCFLPRFGATSSVWGLLKRAGADVSLRFLPLLASSRF